MIIDNINIAPLIKAFKKFETFRMNINTEQEKAGAIQAFEYSFELCWKTMKRLLEVRGKIVNSPREAFRMAALEEFIRDPEIWFEFLKMRNITTLTYQEEEAGKVVSIFSGFSTEIKYFLMHLGVQDV